MKGEWSPSPSTEKEIIMKKQFIAVAVIASFIPAAAFAGPSIGLGYSDVGLSGHAGRPGVTLTAGNVYKNDVVASGQATYASGYYGVNADLGKLIHTAGVGFEPYASLGFTSYTQPQAASVTDLYGLAGVNLSVPFGRRVTFGVGGAYGHTLTTYGAHGGQVYTGDAVAAFQIAPRVSTDLSVSYLHLPRQSAMQYGAGLSYHFS
jgi:hypothetical protein